MKEPIERSCIDCGVTNCNHEDKSYPDFCLTTKMREDSTVLDGAIDLYLNDEDNQKIASAAAEVGAEHYCKFTRVEETMAFAKKMNFKKIGIATCVGLIREASIAARIFRAHGFEVFGIACKAGVTPKVKIGIDKKCEAVGVNMCNPILQAKMLNAQHTDLNVVIGLCVGHDSLFYKYSEAVTTTLVVKDRVLGHNPVAALYQAGSYYSKLMKDDE